MPVYAGFQHRALKSELRFPYYSSSQILTTMKSPRHRSQPGPLNHWCQNTYYRENVIAVTHSDCHDIGELGEVHCPARGFGMPREMEAARDSFRQVGMSGWVLA